MTRGRRHKRLGAHASAIKAAAIWGGALLLLIGIIVAQSAETIKTGYQIAALNALWQEKNFERIMLEQKINGFTEMGKIDKFVKRHFNLQRAEPGQIVFVRDENAPK